MSFESVKINEICEVSLLLTDDTSSITQLKKELVYKHLNLLSRIIKLTNETNNCMFELKKLDTVVETKKKQKKS
ncbi:hypothetical protein BB561_001702 [Smittium simulii]|uniref:Uncharacterized protein n=1 Tax=Smittium simulii TaxID=133385 RepID=A0A2T9YTJ2_9FUNG|nr:hypothetical protein BB561_001702 [Smittium simulii]